VAARPADPPPPPAAKVQEPPSASAYKVVNIREDDVLNVRSGPSSEHAVVAALQPGSRGVIITGDCESDWCPVQHAAGSGWVNRTFLVSET
ncbi:SH3 domain-containing protein, partial [Salmonella enterica]|uniref:SH3 domain-containing protein n=1 Tax=Salmonella enterica TaxID=28901 RepID=UPI003CF401B6